MTISNFYLKNVQDTILGISKETKNLDKAFLEWYYTGHFNDRGRDPLNWTTCELCGYEGIRFEFLIRNDYVGNSLLVGSKCIEKFKINAKDEEGYLMDQKHSLKKLRSDLQSMRRKAEMEETIEELQHLKNVIYKKPTKKFIDINNFIKYYRNNFAFTPKQLLLIFNLMNEKSIECNKKNYKIKIKRDREKDQLAQLDTSEVSIIWNALSKSQKLFYIYKSDFIDILDIEDEDDDSIINAAENYLF